METNQIWYFTFGLAHPFKDCIQPIRGNYEKARAIMFNIYGKKWAFQYEENKGRELIAKYRYQLLPEINAEED